MWRLMNQEQLVERDQYSAQGSQAHFKIVFP